MAQAPTVQEPRIAALPHQVIEHNQSEDTSWVIASFNLQDDADDFAEWKKLAAGLREIAMSYEVREDPAWTELRARTQRPPLQRDPAVTEQLMERDV